MTSDRVRRLRSANTWLNEGDCCGQRDANGTCMAPACIFGEALKMAHEAAARIEQLEAEVQTWVNHTKTAVWSDSEECKMLTRINAALIEAPTVDINVVVPDRDYSAMTPKDCYEAGLLDGVYQAREAIKAAVRAALDYRQMKGEK